MLQLLGEFACVGFVTAQGFFLLTHYVTTTIETLYMYDRPELLR